MPKPIRNRGAEPARKALGPVFDAVPKCVFGRVAYHLARHSGPKGADVGDKLARRRLLEVWDQVAPEGLPLPSPEDRAALAEVGL